MSKVRKRAIFLPFMYVSLLGGVLFGSTELSSCANNSFTENPIIMFTEQQIREAHRKVKSGADYPRYVQDLKKLGVAKYDYVVENGKNVYFDQEGRSVTITLYPASRVVSDVSSSEKLKQYLHIHQEGKTDYSTFCLQAAEAGVERWASDLNKMLCSYYNKKGEVLYAEPIPEL